MRLREKVNLYPLFLALFSIALYANTLNHQYAFDDNLVTPIHPQVQLGIKGIPAIFTSNYTTGLAAGFEYRPLTKATFAVEYEFFGENPFISHLINMLLYCTTCIVLFRLTSSLFRSKGALFAFTAGLIFLAHPAHTEVVCSLKNREELLSFLFCLLSAKYTVKSVQTSKYRYFVPAFLLFCLSLFTKLTCLPFLLIIPLCAYYAETQSPRPALYSFLTLSIPTGIFFYITHSFLPDTYDRTVQFIENPVVNEGTAAVLILNSLQTLWLYFKLAVWPHPLSFYYGYDVIPLPRTISPGIAISFILHGAMLIYTLLKVKKRDILAFAFLFYLMNMAMYSNLVFPVPGIISDRALYVSSFGFSLAIAVLLTRFNYKRSMLLCALLLVPASVKTYLRNRDWKDNQTLIGKDIGHLNRSVKANLEYASLLKNQWENENNTRHRAELAGNVIRYYNRSLKIKPDMATPYNEIGEVLFHQDNNYEKAQEYFSRAIHLSGSNPEFHFNQATAYVMLGNYANAEKSFLTTIDLEPDYTKALHNLFLIYLRQSRLEEAYAINEGLMEKIPNEPHAYFNFGKYYLATGDSNRALVFFAKVDSMSPGNAEASAMLQLLRERKHY